MVLHDAFDDGVDAALQLVRGAGDWPGRDEAGFQEREERAVALQTDEPVVGAAHPLVRPPPLPSPGVEGIVLGVGSFLDERAVLVVPPVQPDQPGGRLAAVTDFGEAPGEFQQFASGPAPGLVGQIRPGAPEHVHQAALDPCPFPAFPRDRETSCATVADQHSGLSYPHEQPPVGGLALPFAPLPGDGPAVLARGDQQAPAIRQIRAVDLDVAMNGPALRDARTHVPAPRDPRGERLPDHTKPGGGLAQRLLARDPCQERAKLRHALEIGTLRGRTQRAGIAPPALGARIREPLLAHRHPADRASPGLGRLPFAHGTSKTKKSSTLPH